VWGARATAAATAAATARSSCAPAFAKETHTQLKTLSSLPPLPPSQVLLLDNVRFYPEEEKNDPAFAAKLAANADIYVNDAFGTAHRAHASTEGVAKILTPAVAGFVSRGCLIGGHLDIWCFARRRQRLLFDSPSPAPRNQTKTDQKNQPKNQQKKTNQKPPPNRHQTHTKRPNQHPQLLQKELDYLDGAVSAPKRPFAAIVGGSKVSSKITVIESLLGKVDKLFICGGMVFTFLKARGISVGGSLVEEDKLDLARELELKAAAKGVKIILPVDVIAADKFAPDAATQVVAADKIPDGWLGLDQGPESNELFAKELR